MFSGRFQVRWVQGGINTGVTWLLRGWGLGSVYSGVLFCVLGSLDVSRVGINSHGVTVVVIWERLGLVMWVGAVCTA